MRLRYELLVYGLVMLHPDFNCILEFQLSSLKSFMAFRAIKLPAMHGFHVFEKGFFRIVHSYFSIQFPKIFVRVSPSIVVIYSIPEGLFDASLYIKRTSTSTLFPCLTCEATQPSYVLKAPRLMEPMRNGQISQEFGGQVLHASPI